MACAACRPRRSRRPTGGSTSPTSSPARGAGKHRSGGGPDAPLPGASWTRRRARSPETGSAELFAEVHRLADARHQIELRLEPVRVLLLAVEDRLQQLAAAVVAALEAQRDPLPEP